MVIANRGEIAVRVLRTARERGWSTVVLHTADEAASADAFEVALRTALAGAMERLARLRDDPEIRALLSDPELLDLVDRRDALGLLSHPRLREALRRAST